MIPKLKEARMRARSHHCRETASHCFGIPAGMQSQGMPLGITGDSLKHFLKTIIWKASCYDWNLSLMSVCLDKTEVGGVGGGRVDLAYLSLQGMVIPTGLFTCVSHTSRFPISWRSAFLHFESYALPLTPTPKNMLQCLGLCCCLPNLKGGKGNC